MKAYAKEILGKTLITHQTGPEGKVVNQLYIEQGCNIKKEYYISILVDRAVGMVTMMASSEGGMDIKRCSENSRKTAQYSCGSCCRPSSLSSSTTRISNWNAQ